MSGAALSALLGAGLVVASHLVTLLVARATAGAPGPVAAPALALAYVGKVFVLGWVLLTVPAPPWLAPGWLAGGVLVALTASLARAARSSAARTRAALEAVPRARPETPHDHGAAAPADAPEPDDGGTSADEHGRR